MMTNFQLYLVVMDYDQSQRTILFLRKVAASVLIQKVTGHFALKLLIPETGQGRKYCLTSFNYVHYLAGFNGLWVGCADNFICLSDQYRKRHRFVTGKLQGAID